MVDFNYLDSGVKICSGKYSCQALFKAEYINKNTIRVIKSNIKQNIILARAHYLQMYINVI